MKRNTFFILLVFGCSYFMNLNAQSVFNQQVDDILIENNYQQLYIANAESQDVADITELKDMSFPTEMNFENVETMLSKDPNQLTAGLLAILLGDFGVQHFYTGQTLRGVLDILFCWTGIPAIIGLVEGIIWLTEDEDDWAERVARWNN